MTESGARKVGVIGLGLMGSALADALLDQGFSVVVWNRSPQKCERYADTVAIVTMSAEDVALQTDLLVVCLSDYQASMDVLGAGAVANNLKGKLLVLLSTMSDDDSLRVVAWADTHGIGYLDGSILGYPDDIRKQQCMVVYSGPKTLFDANSGELNAMGGIARHLGEKAGMAPLFDKAVYSTYYSHCLGVAHGAAMCRAMGAPLEVYIESLTEHWDFPSADAAFLDKIVNKDYSVTDCAMQVHAAAFGYVVSLSEKLGIDSSLPKVISNCFEAAEEKGYGESELPALFEILKKR